MEILSIEKYHQSDIIKPSDDNKHMEDKEMNQMYKDMAERMATSIRVMNISIDNYENKRECPFYSELRGMEMALKTMDIEFEYTFDTEVKEITSVTVMGHTVEI